MSFLLFWKLIKQMASDLNINEPMFPRQRKQPRRYEDGMNEGEFPESVEDLYRHMYFEALDLVVCGIKGRFDQPGYEVYSNLEGMLVKAVRKDNHDEELQYIVDFYKGDFNRDQLSMQLGVLSSNVSSDSAQDLKSILKYLQKLSQPERSLLSEVCTLASLILVMPATNAVSERSFSSLQHLKSYLRSTMSQTRLNNLMVLHIHSNCTDQLCLTEIGNKFIQGSTHRETIFGKFLPTDSTQCYFFKFYIIAHHLPMNNYVYCSNTLYYIATCCC